MEDKFICKCDDVKIGSYDNQIWVHSPAHMPKENGYCLDLCIAEEVMQLWRIGIATTGCCCGHNTVLPFIGVIDEDIVKMKLMGYEVAYNTMRPKDEDSFRPHGIMEANKYEMIKKKNRGFDDKNNDAN